MNRKQRMAEKKARRRARRVATRPDAPLMAPPSNTLPGGPVVGVVEHLDLAKAERLDPGLLVRGKDHQVGIFFLALALAFNDLKGFISSMFWLGERKPDGSAPPELAGEYAGHNAHVTRFVAALIRELIKVLWKYRKLIEEPEISRLTSSLRGPAAVAWKALTDVAWSSEPQGHGIFQALKKVRDDVAYHYANLDALGDGYIAHFAKNPHDERFSRAWVSHGRTMQQTRFLYADAAASAAVETAAGMSQQEWDLLLTADARINGKDGLAGQVSIALHALLGLFIESRQSAPPLCTGSA